LGFLYTFFVNRSKGFFGGKVWWQCYRPIHAFMYGAYGVLTLLNVPGASVLILSDLILAISFRLSQENVVENVIENNVDTADSEIPSSS
jgi:hypothetical protein